MLQPLQKYFPKTFELLTKPQRSLIDVEFFRDFTIPQDIRYFPMLLKQMKLEEKIVQTADYEYLIRWTETAEEVLVKTESQFRLNSTLQWIVLESAAEYLEKIPGLYAIWKFQGQLMERKLSETEAQLIADLHEHPELVSVEVTDPMVANLQSVGILEVHLAHDVP